MFDKIINTCSELLNTHQSAEATRNYLNDRLDIKYQKEFNFGYFPSNINLLLNFLDEKELIKSELFYYRIIDGEKYLTSFMENHNLVLPYRDAYGKIIALVGRTILDDNERKLLKISKYKNTSFIKANHLFGLDRAKEHIIKENSVFVVEGQFDCIRAMINGIKNCVCLGSGSMSFNQFAVLSRYTDNIVLLLDNDDAGRAGADKIIKSYGNRANIRKLFVPDGYKDLDQFLTSDGEAGKEFLKFIN